MSEIIQSQVQIWRQRCKDGTMTTEEMVEVINKIRGERIAATAISTKSRATAAEKKAKAAPINSDDLLNELGGL